MDPNELLKQLGIDLTRDAEDLEPIEGEHKFTIYTRDRAGNGMALKAWTEKDEVSGEDEHFLSGIASSTIKDLHGDTMLPSALVDMEQSARNNLTIFLNHKYEVPEDVAGSVRAASIASNAIDEKTGAPIYDLNFEKIRMDRENERAIKSHRSMKAGTKLGLSIGARIPEGGAIRNKKTGTLLIAHVDLLETSIVGIPANPRSWIDAATKSINSAPRIFAGVDIGDTAEALEPLLPALHFHVEETSVSLDGTDTITEPSTTDDTAPSQDLAESAPENDGADATPDVIAAASDVLERTADSPVDEDQARALLVEAHNALADATSQLIDLDAALAAATKRADDAEAERDAMKVSTEVVIADVANLIERVGKLPAGRQASFKSIADATQGQAVDWESMGFAPEVVRMLKRGNQ